MQPDRVLPNACARQISARRAGTGFASGSRWGLWRRDQSTSTVVASKQHNDVRGSATSYFRLTVFKSTLKNLDVGPGASTRPPFDDGAMVDAVPIFHERIRAVIADDSPLASRPEVRFATRRERAVAALGPAHPDQRYMTILELCARNGVAPPMVQTPERVPAIAVQWVASGKACICLGVDWRARNQPAAWPSSCRRPARYRESTWPSMK